MQLEKKVLLGANYKDQSHNDAKTEALWMMAIDLKKNT